MVKRPSGDDWYRIHGAELLLYEHHRLPSPEPIDEHSYPVTPLTLELLVYDDDPCVPEQALLAVLRTRLLADMEKILWRYPRERAIIEWRYGFYEYARTLDEVSEMFNITRERVRQLEIQGLERLRLAYGGAW